MRISYAIPVCNEDKELDRLLSQLTKAKTEEDEIVVQCDLGNTTPEVYKVLEQYTGKVKVVEFSLNGDFATFKNNLKANCKGNWIFQIDADEYLNESFLYSLPFILSGNPEVDLFLVPRINTVEGLTQDHINKWQWRVDEKGWVNFPDYQTRILRNSPKITWTSKVHEVLTGHSNYVVLPAEEDYCLYHPKEIERQEKQNAYYASI